MLGSLIGPANTARACTCSHGASSFGSNSGYGWGEGHKVGQGGGSPVMEEEKNNVYVCVCEGGA